MLIKLSFCKYFISGGSKRTHTNFFFKDKKKPRRDKFEKYSKYTKIRKNEPAIPLSTNIIENKNFPTISVEDSPYIYILAPEINWINLLKYIKNYGEIKDFDSISNPKIFRIEFMKIDSKNKIIDEKSHKIGNFSIRISSEMKDLLDYKTFDKEVSYDSIYKLYNISGVENQLEFLVNNFCAEKEQEWLLDDLLRILNKFIASNFNVTATTKIYGSRAFEFPLKNSDVDFSFIFPANLSKKINLREINRNRNFQGLFEWNHLIPSKRYPIIKAGMKELNITADVSIDNFMALRNNQLILKYFALARKFEPGKFNLFNSLILVLKIWRAVNGISGDVNLHINSYGWILMIIYYLQRINYFPPLQNFPRLEKTIKNYSESDIDRCVINEWDCSFYSDIEKFPPPENIPDLQKAIVGFFDFYLNNFDFKKYIVDIRTGGEISVTREKCFDDLSRSRANINNRIFGHFQKPIVIQDPLELSHNIAKILDYIQIQYILNTCRKTLNIINNSSKLSGKKHKRAFIVSMFSHAQMKSIQNESKIICKVNKDKSVNLELTSLLKEIFQQIHSITSSKFIFMSEKLNNDPYELEYGDLENVFENFHILQKFIFKIKSKYPMISEKISRREALISSKNLINYEISFDKKSKDCLEIKFTNINLNTKDKFYEFFENLKEILRVKFNNDEIIRVS